jgi:hypothetical protein
MRKMLASSRDITLDDVVIKMGQDIRLRNGTNDAVTKISQNINAKLRNGTDNVVNISVWRSSSVIAMDAPAQGSPISLHSQRWRSSSAIVTDAPA